VTCEVEEVEEVEEVDVALLVVVVDVVTLLVELELVELEVVVVEVDCSGIELVVVLFDLELGPESAKYAPAPTTTITTSATAARVWVPIADRVFTRFSPVPNFGPCLRRSVQRKEGVAQFARFLPMPCPRWPHEQPWSTNRQDRS
jgi:hypothetical protein